MPTLDFVGRSATVLLLSMTLSAVTSGSASRKTIPIAPSKSSCPSLPAAPPTPFRDFSATGCRENGASPW